MSRVYILTDDKNRVTRIEGEYTLPSNLVGWVLIEEGASCDRLNLAQTHYLTKPLLTDDGIYQYKYSDGNIIERTDEEIQADRENRPTPEPTLEDRLEAQVYYTAVMTDTLIEEE